MLSNVWRILKCLRVSHGYTENRFCVDNNSSEMDSGDKITLFWCRDWATQDGYLWKYDYIDEIMKFYHFHWRNSQCIEINLRNDVASWKFHIANFVILMEKRSIYTKKKIQLNIWVSVYQVQSAFLRVQSSLNNKNIHRVLHLRYVLLLWISQEQNIQF